MRNPDPEKHYAALNVSHDATHDEIRLAYEMVKLVRKEKGRKVPGEIQAAYDVLGDRERRKAYGKKPASGVRRFKINLNSVPLLLTLLVLFVGIIVFALAPVIMAHFVTFEEGDSLYWKQSLKPLGVVREFESGHRFEGGAQSSAYRIEHTSGTTAWYAAVDLQRHCARN